VQPSIFSPNAIGIYRADINVIRVTGLYATDISGKVILQPEKSIKTFT
jgi:hypothetical protein